MNARFLFAVVFFSYLFSSYAQVTKVKFGKVSLEDASKSTYEADTSAKAVALYTNGYFDANQFKFTLHIRIKILKKEGASFANWSIRTPTKSMIRAMVFNKEGDAIAETKLERSAILEEEIVQGLFIYKFFLENVKEGSILDVEYSFPGLPLEYRFQEVIPVAYAELHIEQSPYLTFDKRFFGFHPLTTIGPNHWMAKNVPAFVSEPFMNDYSNYLTKIQFEVSAVTFPRFYRLYSETWEQVNDYLINQENFLAAETSTFFLNEKAKEIKEMDTTLQGKLYAAHQYIKENMAWNGTNTLYVTTFFSNNFKKLHTGNSAEINLALLFLLKKAGIPASAVVLSTRDNGLLVPFYPSIDNLNYVVVMVPDGESYTLLDATEKHGSPGILPKKCLNGDGLVVTEEGVKWVDLLKGRTHKETNLAQITRNDLNEWVAEVKTTRNDYSYLEWANSFDQFNKSTDRYMEYLNGEQPSYTLEEYELAKHQPEKLVVTERMKINLTDHVDDLGNEVFIKPFFILSELQNPFKNDERKYPVDFAYPSEKSIILLFSIPDGYTVKSLPQSINSVIPENGGDVTILFNQTGTSIQMQFKLKIKKVVFSETEYQYLREFYSIIIDKLSESIQLVKS